MKIWNGTKQLAKGEDTIAIKGRTYKVTDTISNFRAFSILGRATRIFIAQDMKSKGSEKVVIKDIWADATRNREQEIQRQIQEDLMAKGLQGMGNFFFEHLSFEDVPTSDGELDSTVKMSRNSEGKELDLSGFESLSIRLNFKEGMPSNSIGLTPSHNTSLTTTSNVQSVTPHPSPLRVVPRVHYRLVMKEVGMPLQEVHDLRNCMRALINLNERKSLHK
jgi:hypothetical protein